MRFLIFGNKSGQKKGFTLVELLVVISIISLLSSSVLVALQSARSKAVIASSIEYDSALYHSFGSDLIGQWLFDEGSGSIAGDLLGKGINGTIAGATWTDGVSGKALTFTGSGTYVSLGNDPALDPQNFTITAWIKPSDFSGSYNYIFSNARDSGGAYNGMEFLVSHNYLRGRIWNGSVVNIAANTAIADNAPWTFVAFSYDGNKMRLFIDGKINSTANSTAGIGSPASFSARIGGMGYNPASYGMKGSIDQVRFYSTPITAVEIERQYASEKKMYLAKI